MTREDAIALAQDTAVRSEEASSVWRHRLQGRFVVKGHNEEAPRGPLWMLEATVAPDGSVDIAPTSAEPVVPITLGASEAVAAFGTWIAGQYGVTSDASKPVIDAFLASQDLPAPEAGWEATVKPLPADVAPPPIVAPAEKVPSG